MILPTGMLWNNFSLYWTTIIIFLKFSKNFTDSTLTLIYKDAIQSEFHIANTKVNFDWHVNYIMLLDSYTAKNWSKEQINLTSVRA